MGKIRYWNLISSNTLGDALANEFIDEARRKASRSNTGVGFSVREYVTDYYNSNKDPIAPDEEPGLVKYLASVDYPTFQAIKTGFRDNLHDFIHEAKTF